MSKKPFDEIREVLARIDKANLVCPDCGKSGGSETVHCHILEVVCKHCGRQYFSYGLDVTEQKSLFKRLLNEEAMPLFRK